MVNGMNMLEHLQFLKKVVYVVKLIMIMILVLINLWLKILVIIKEEE